MAETIFSFFNMFGLPVPTCLQGLDLDSHPSTAITTNNRNPTKNTCQNEMKIIHLNNNCQY